MVVVPELFGVGGAQDFLDRLTNLAHRAPAALEAVDPGLARVKEPTLDAIAETFMFRVRARDTLLLLLQRKIEEFPGLILHSGDDFTRYAVVDYLHESPLGECLDKQLRGGVSCRRVVESRQVDSGELLGEVEIIVGHQRPLIFRPDELTQIRTRATKQIRFHRFRTQSRVVVAHSSLQAILDTKLVHKWLHSWQNLLRHRHGS